MLHNKTMCVLTPFAAPYLCESWFSAVAAFEKQTLMNRKSWRIN